MAWTVSWRADRREPGQAPRRTAMSSMTIAALMQTRVHSVGMDAPIAEVEALLREHKLSWLPVIDPEGPSVAGVISVTDLMHFHAEKRDPATAHAWQLCTYKPVSVSPDTSVAEVARLMLDRGIHHVVVTSANRLVGVVSALDFVRRFAA
jgi:CBS domain-containing protein